jgi:hypothetical protein
MLRGTSGYHARLIGTVSFGTVSHPSLGLPPRSLTAGHPEAASRLRDQRSRLAARAIEVAVDADRTLATRHGEAGLRNLLRDAEVLVDRLALCVAGDDPHWLREFADQTATVFRRRRVPMDDVVQVCEGLRAAAQGVLRADEMASADRGLDAAVEVYRWYRRIGGDARRRNPILAKLYRGA